MEEKWTLRYDEATGRLFIIAQGFASEDNSREAARRFLDLLGSRTVDLVVDLDRMTGYTTAARQVWQHCFRPVRSQLRRMLVVGRDIPGLVRMGASVVAAFAGIPIRFFPTVESMDGRATSDP